MKIKYCFLAITMIIVIVFSLCGCSLRERTKVTGTLDYKDFDFRSESLEHNDVFENGSLSVRWDDKTKQVSFTDKTSGNTYSSMPENTSNTNLRSPIIISYYSPSTFSDVNAFASTEAIDTDSVYAEKIDNGFKVYYEFLNLETVVPVEYKLEKDCFTITVNPKEIFDAGDNYITGVSLAPFLCSVKNDAENSYLFYPDGSGTLFSNKTLSKIGEKGSKRVYGEDMLVSKYDLPSYTKQVNLPVFGAKTGDTALFAIITDGAELANLNWNVGSQNIGYSTVYPHFKIRGYNLVNPPSRFANTKAHIQVFDSNITSSPLSVAYYPLSGDKANYSGMAECYKNYLRADGKLSTDDKTPVALSLKLIGGVQKKIFTFGIPHTVLHPLTTVNQASEIIEYFNNAVEGKVTVNLVGFGQSGLDTGSVGGGFKIAKTFGDKKAINALSQLCKKNDTDLFMDFDIISYSASGSGFSALDDSAKLPSGQTAYLYFPDNITRNYDSTQRYMLLSRASLKKAIEKSVNASDGYGFAGVAFGSLSSISYADYSVNGAELGGGMAETVSGLFSGKAIKKKLMVSAANGYALYNADYATDVPLSSSGYNISEIDVPFYEMVFRGSVSLSSGSLNTASDTDKMFLQCIEAGVTPSYTVIGEYDNTVVASRFSILNTAQYDGIKCQIEKNCESFNALLSKIGNAQIVKHTVLDNGLRITEYEGGIVTAVNYGDTPQSYGGYTVPAADYKVWEVKN